MIETALARRKNKGMLLRARRGNFYDLPGLLLNIQLFNKIILKGTFSGEMLHIFRNCPAIDNREKETEFHSVIT